MSKRILIIEDEKILAEMYQEKFKQTGFEVISAMEAEEGLRIAEKEKPDLILLDILLPRENGIFFLKNLKNNKEISSIPVIVFSNFDDPNIRKQAKQFGAKDYLIKTDYTPRQIVEQIKKFIN